MKIKGKLFLGLGALFVFIVLIVILSSFYLNKLSSDTKNILVANYNSLSYSREMMLALDDDITNLKSAKRFSDHLEHQQKNVTEIGEQQATEKLNNDYTLLKANPNDAQQYKLIRKDIADIMQLNMEAIQRKSIIAAKTADNAITWITLVGTLCFIIAFTLLVNFPGNIANPIKELTLSIQHIASENYSERVHFRRFDEFGEMASAFNTMAEKLEEYNNSNMAKLMTEKKRIETLINNIHEPVIGLDENKHIIFINNEALQITNLKAGNILGKPIQDIAVSNDLVRILIKDFFEKQGKNEPLKIYADNKESYFQKEIIPIDITPTGEKEMQHIGDVIFLKNITPFKELDFAKTNFIATVSHELKTPISSIIMSTQLLANVQVGDLNSEQQNLLESIKDDAARLLKITGELLNMTQLESGKIQLQIAPSNPVEILEKAIQNNRTIAESKNIKLDISVPENLPLIKVDADKISWVVSNLISNAIRYSYEYSIVYATISLNEQLSTLNIIVRDTGQGIAPQHINRIFDRYYRIPGSKKEGTGLGLAISKELLEAQEGTISVQSELGVGSTFNVAIPIYSQAQS
jgi:two-component system, NtrC family, sensor histidine kinase KinB